MEIDRNLGLIIDKMEDSSKGNRIKAVCLQCQAVKQQTNHRVLKSYRIVGTNLDYPNQTDDEIEESYLQADWHGMIRINRSDEFQIIQCQGCETVTFRELHWNDKDNREIQEILHPKRSVSKIQEKDCPNLPANILGIYKETIHNYNAENFILCTAGVRAIVEGICTSQGIKKGPKKIEEPDGKRDKDLQSKIYGLVEKEILTKSQADALHELRFLGNSALHQLEKPSEQDLAQAIEIIENILEFVFEMPVKGKVLKDRRANIPAAEPNLAV